MKTELHAAIQEFKALDNRRDDGALNVEEQARWEALKDMLERVTMPDTDAAPPSVDAAPSSRRRSLRVPARMEVSFEDAKGFERAYLRNISEGGVYIETDKDLAMGHRFDLAMRVEAETLELRVEVVWINANPSPSSGLARGVGVAWLDLPSEDKRTIKAIIHRALDSM
jgi:uncharacterized protein (TIGR02266 family)